MRSAEHGDECPNVCCLTEIGSRLVGGFLFAHESLGRRHLVREGSPSKITLECGCLRGCILP